MSINSDVSNLNLGGQVFLGGVTSVVVNGTVHPLNTMTRILQTSSGSLTQQLAGMTVKHLYQGIGAMCFVDFFALGTAYAINDAIPSIPQPWSSALAGLVSAPVAAIGEGFAINRQVNHMTYAECAKKAFKPVGFSATVLRDVSYPFLMLYAAPALQNKIETQFSSKTPVMQLMAQTIAGGGVGAVGGFMTAPFDLLKTRIQASQTPLKMLDATKAIAKKGVSEFFRGGSARSAYLGAFGAGVNIVINIAPRYFPSLLQKNSDKVI